MRRSVNLAWSRFWGKAAEFRMHRRGTQFRNTPEQYEFARTADALQRTGSWTIGQIETLTKLIEAIHSIYRKPDPVPVYIREILLDILKARKDDLETKHAFALKTNAHSARLDLLQHLARLNDAEKFLKEVLG